MLNEDHHRMLMAISVAAIVVIVMIVVFLPLVLQNLTGEAERCKTGGGDCQAPVAGKAYSIRDLQIREPLRRSPLAVGFYCSSNSQCSSNLCLNNQCRASNLGTGQRCTWTEQCQSGLYCPQTVPVGPSRVCTQKLTTGQSCSGDEACVSNRCDPVDDACEVYQCVPPEDDASYPVCDVPY